MPESKGRSLMEQITAVMSSMAVIVKAIISLIIALHTGN
jgi:hypothetical protein